MKKDTTAKLADVEARMRRWHTRLTRASNMLQRLERQRRRLQLQQQVGIGRPRPVVKPAAPGETSLASRIDVEEVRRQLDAAIDTTIPPEFKRVDVDALKAQRKSKDAPDKIKMPLTGRAALDAARPKRRA